MSTTTEEFITSFTSHFGPHPGHVVVLALIIGVCTVPLLIAYLIKRHDVMSKKDIPVLLGASLLVIACAVVGLMSEVAMFDSIDAREPEVKAVAKHYGLTQDPSYKNSYVNYENSPQGIWMNKKGEKFTQCTVLTRQINDYHYSHRLSCLKIGDNDNVMFPVGVKS